MMTEAEYKSEVARLRPALLAQAQRYVHDADDAEDVVQDVLLKMWTVRDELRLPLGPLARVLVRNGCVDWLRRRREHQELEVDVADDQSPPDERIERVMSIIESLPPMQQMVMRLRHMEGMEMAQIAQIVGSTEVAVRKALSRARQQIRNHYTNTP